MEAFALSLRNEHTLFAKGTEHKDTIQIKTLAELPSILPALLAEDREELIQFFATIAGIVKRKEAKLTISLPSSLVLMNCGFLENVPANYLQKELDRLAYRLLRLEPTDPYNVDKALIITQRKTVWLTSAGVAQKYIELLWEAALQAGLILAAVENESIAAFRTTDFKEACGYVEVIDQDVFLSGFSPEQGMFTVQSQFCGQMDKQLILQQAFELFDTAATDTFSQSSNSLPLYIDGQDYQQLQDYQRQDTKRLTPLCLPESVTSKAYTQEQLQAFALPIGLLLQPIFERRGKREKIRSDQSRNK